MLLTTEERLKFILYLRQNIESSRLIIEQLSKLPNATLMVKKEATRMAAWMVVAADLDSTESFEVSCKETDDV